MYPGEILRAVIKVHMETIRVVLDAELLKAVDFAAKRQEVNRSALIRQALQEHLNHLTALELEARDRAGYRAQPHQAQESRRWEDAAAWPEC
jgi:metal-responsive CopG/Arc/MetJ family transcriptional regulator